MPPHVTRVSGKAITMLSARARRSDDTSGKSVTPMIPATKLPARKAALIASACAGRANITAKSTADTDATGTRTADPSIRPAKSGRT